MRPRTPGGARQAARGALLLLLPGGYLTSFWARLGVGQSAMLADDPIVGVARATARACRRSSVDSESLALAPRARPTEVDALELLADDDHAVLGVRTHARQELAGVQLDGQLFTVFAFREGQLVDLRDHAHRADALSEAGLDYHSR